MYVFKALLYFKSPLTFKILISTFHIVFSSAWKLILCRCQTAFFWRINFFCIIVFFLQFLFEIVFERPSSPGLYSYTEFHHLFTHNRWEKWNTPAQNSEYVVSSFKFQVFRGKILIFLDFLKRSASRVSHFPWSLFWTEMITNVARSHSGLITPAQQKTHSSKNKEQDMSRCIFVSLLSSGAKIRLKIQTLTRDLAACFFLAKFRRRSAERVLIAGDMGTYGGISQCGVGRIKKHQEMTAFCPRADLLQLETRLALLLHFPKTFFLSLRFREAPLSLPTPTPIHTHTHTHTQTHNTQIWMPSRG